jgi:hypothetical protein
MIYKKLFRDSWLKSTAQRPLKITYFYNRWHSSGFKTRDSWLKSTAQRPLKITYFYNRWHSSGFKTISLFTVFKNLFCTSVKYIIFMSTYFLWYCVQFLGDFSDIIYNYSRQKTWNDESNTKASKHILLHCHQTDARIIHSFGQQHSPGGPTL